ncbi:MAG: helix-turn-helix domain-containing protein [Clostridia bacterium]|nr:helix-turn-helix domain-containing protein [Clostridia bacterium]
MSLLFDYEHLMCDSKPSQVTSVKNINYFPHSHSGIEIIYIVSGDTTVTSEDESYNLRKGDIAIFMPGQIHAFKSVNENEALILSASPLEITENVSFFAYRMAKNRLYKNTSLNTKAVAYIEEIKAELDAKEIGYTLKVSSIINALVCDILRTKAGYSLDESELRRVSANVSLLKSVDEFISANYKENVSLADVSEYCDLSVFYFSHIFKEATNITFYDYLTAYRLDHTLEMLKEGNLKMAEIAPLCGFATMRTFNRSFKGFFGVSPTEYLKNED